MTRTFRWLLLLGCAAAMPVAAQQVPDRDFRPALGTQPSFAPARGPVVCVDAAHHNFHTLDDRFFAFAELLRRDGYVVRANRDVLDAQSLQRCAVLVISNAQPSGEDWNDYPSPTPAAFTPAEIAATRAWVEAGGKLLLIADHMPLAGAALALAAAFDVQFSDGFAYPGFADESGRAAAMSRPTLFRRGDGTLAPHAITCGRDAAESVEQVRSFTGQAFQAPGAQPLLVLPPDFISLHPRKAWDFDADTRKVPVGGWLQGAVMPVGAGKAAFFGEAAMFTAQLAGPERRPVGMNAPEAGQNARFVLNLMRWLSEPGDGDPAAVGSGHCGQRPRG